MYSQAKVIAGGLAHIPVVIAVFYFILTTFNKRALEFVEETKTKKSTYSFNIFNLKSKICSSFSNLPVIGV